VRGRVARAVVPALVVLGLVAVVAIAATGSTSSGSDTGRRAPGVLGGTILGLGLVALLASAVLVFYALAHKGPGEYPHTWGGLTQLVVLASFLIALIALNLRDWSLPGLDQLKVAPPPSAVTSTTGDASASANDGRTTWLAALAVLLLAAIAATAFFFATRRRKKQLQDDRELVESLHDVLAETLDDLRGERDPRRAVIAAYARLEHVLAAHGLPRRAAETQAEHIARILDELEVDKSAVQRLADLFQRAKFSQHEVDATMKDEAIETLEQLRDELGAELARRPARPSSTLHTGDEPA